MSSNSLDTTELHHAPEVLGWGTAGAAAAYDISAWGIALAQMVYVVGWCKEGWRGILFIGVNAAVSVRVSNLLGSGHPRAAKYSVVVTVLESLMIGVVSAGIILITKDHFAVIFTDSIEMQKAVSKLAPLLGVAVGGGWQGLVAYINLFCYYIMGLPLGFYLGYKGGYRGIWVGMICGTVLQTAILVEQANERMKQWTGQESEMSEM
ncbi:hypothetical protein TSUD_180010 [Trifolium subterraneum]|uniref:Protein DETOXIFICATION n=1 Tax=Trifolium subterraneum TaxID=3900 RepID=A0A2Z6NGK7_TRISU|nr:hypothetical protein TSUD_180010 [Trifolium subterraneum]